MAYQIGNTADGGYCYMTFFTLNILPYTLDIAISSAGVGYWLIINYTA